MCTSKRRWLPNLVSSLARHDVAAGLVLAFVVLACRPCEAHNTYPQQLADQLGMPCVPQCTLCHRDNLGGFNSVVEPFGISLQKAGLTFFPPTLEPAVKELERDMTDSDRDGVGDIAELSTGRDPNGQIDLCAIETPRYGCGAHIATPPPANYSGVIAAFFMASVLGASAQRRARRRALGPNRRTSTGL